MPWDHYDDLNYTDLDSGSKNKVGARDELFMGPINRIPIAGRGPPYQGAGKPRRRSSH